MSYGRDGKKGGEGLDADIANIEVSYEMESEKQDNTKNITSIPTTQSEKDSYIEIGIEQLLKEHSENEVAAKRRYNGKKIRLSENIDKIGEDDKGKIYIRIGSIFDYATCYFNDDESDSVMQLKEGQNVIIEGICESHKYFPSLLNCRIVNPKKEPQSSKPESAPVTKSDNNDYVELNPKIFKTEDDREAQATENAYTFEQKIIELANQISSSNQHNYQDMELVESNAMVDDEIVYMRAWQGKGYFFIRNYENKSWSNNHLTHFYINDKSSVNFTGRVKVGCTLDDLTAVFGDKLEWSGSDRPREYTLTTRSEWIMNFYISSKGYVNEIQYTTVGSITSKMSLLYAFNSGELLAADVADQKVNIRDYPDASGSNVVFQVNRSKDTLLVVDKDNSHTYAVYNNYGEDWYRVVGRISGNKFIPVEGEAYVIYKYIDIRPMTNVERNMVSSVLN